MPAHVHSYRICLDTWRWVQGATRVYKPFAPEICFVTLSCFLSRPRTEEGLPPFLVERASRLDALPQTVLQWPSRYARCRLRVPSLS